LLNEVAMHRMLLCALAALASLSLVPLTAHAQAAFTNPYTEWSLRPDVPRVPFDGAPFSEKYTNSFIFNSTPLMLGGNSAGMWYLYRLDKIYRAQMFGYELPANYHDPATGQIIMPPPPPRHGRLWNFFHYVAD
jgi:hypothetical protein